MRRVLTYGTFDLMHYGHIRLLKRAKKNGDYLVVAIATDEFNAIKGKKAYHNYKTRKRMLEAIKYVDLVIPKDGWGQKINDVKKYQIDCFVVRDDWEGKFDKLKEYCDVVYLPRTKGVSTSKIKKDLGI